MMQHPIDLLPEFVRIKSEQGVRAGRYIAAVIVALILVVIATTHMRFELDRSRERLARAEEQANIVLELEQRAAELTAGLDQAAERIELHEALRFPFEISQLLSTVTNQLPASVTIERLDINANPRHGSTAAAQKKDGENTPQRLSAGELNGFAASDDHIGELVARMEASRIFQSVTWDFSRSRTVRDRSAREFRISFRIDLDELFEVVSHTGEPITDEGRADESRRLANAADVADSR